VRRVFSTKIEAEMRFYWVISMGVLAAFLAQAQTPMLNQGGIGNAASFDFTGVAPGSIVSIFGSDLASSVAIASSVPLSTSLDDVTSVTFNGIPAAFYYVGPLQINAQVPWNVLPGGASTGTASVVATRSTGMSAPVTVPVVASQPGIFTVTQNGTGQGIATDNTDGMIAAPQNSIMGALTHPISLSSGHPLIVWCTGLGAVDPPIDNGAAAGGTLRNTVVKPTILIGGIPAQFIYSVLSPQFVSENQIGVIPAPNTPTGDAVSLQIQVPGYTSTDKVTIAVSP
jgi:uncharacterized protein (TIGR03437 family)